MKKINTTPLSGTQEFLPEMQLAFDKIKSKIADTYHRHGFAEIETPVIDRLEILLAKAGGDTEKQIYKVAKTTENMAEADQGLRFDHTVPLARYVVEHENDLVFPFKVSQIGRNWRGERAQKGRFREFYQCDVDVIGRGNLSLAYDADVISTLIDTFNRLKLDTFVLARISNRKILSGLLAYLGISDWSDDIYSIIDHAEKLPPDETKKALKDLKLPASDAADLILMLSKLHGARVDVIDELRSLKIDNAEFQEGLTELDRVMELLEEEGIGQNISADLGIVRGLDYYTGTVFEFSLPELENVGSVGGGGRYDNLAGYFTEQKLPGVGGSIGLSRFFYILTTEGLLPSDSEKPVDYAIIPMQDDFAPFALKIAKKLRNENNSVTIVYLGDRKLGDKLTYAAKIASKAIVIGENEVASGEYQVKEFK